MKCERFFIDKLTELEKHYFLIAKCIFLDIVENYAIWFWRRNLCAVWFLRSDMRKGSDARTLSAEVLMDCGNIKPDTKKFTLICNQTWKYYGIIVYLIKIHL